MPHRSRLKRNFHLLWVGTFVEDLEGESLITLIERVPSGCMQAEKQSKDEIIDVYTSAL